MMRDLLLLYLGGALVTFTASVVNYVSSMPRLKRMLREMGHDMSDYPTALAFGFVLSTLVCTVTWPFQVFVSYSFDEKKMKLDLERYGL